MSDTRKLTLGERRVRLSFNPSGNEYVDKLKKVGADFIDLINQAAIAPDMSQESISEFMRLKALAMTAIESGTSDAVKMATTPKD